MLDRIQDNINIFSKSERKVAEVILQDPEVAIHSSIATLAAMAEVSEPTVNRFCRRLDTKGFPDFKLQLAQSLATGTAHVSRNIHEDDDTASYAAKIFESTIAGLETTKNNISPQQINHVVDLMIQARKIAFFGLGASASVCHDALNKFLRFNVPVVYFDDLVMQKMTCINSDISDLFVFISYTGCTKELNKVAQIAKDQGATTIAITAKNSPLANICTTTIALDIEDDTDAYMPMISRIVQMAVIDVLATGFTLKRGEKFRDNLKRVKKAIKDTRL